MIDVNLSNSRLPLVLPAFMIALMNMTNFLITKIRGKRGKA
jgi:hypothetical protein